MRSTSGRAYPWACPYGLCVCCIAAKRLNPSSFEGGWLPRHKRQVLLPWCGSGSAPEKGVLFGDGDMRCLLDPEIVGCRHATVCRSSTSWALIVHWTQCTRHAECLHQINSFTLSIRDLKTARLQTQNNPTYTCALPFKFGLHVDHSKSQPTDNKLSLKGVWSRHVTHFKFLCPLKYIWNG